jgi:hypothetical protein
MAWHGVAWCGMWHGMWHGMAWRGVAGRGGAGWGGAGQCKNITLRREKCCTSRDSNTLTRKHNLNALRGTCTRHRDTIRAQRYTARPARATASVQLVRALLAGGALGEGRMKAAEFREFTKGV